MRRWWAAVGVHSAHKASIYIQGIEHAGMPGDPYGRITLQTTEDVMSAAGADVLLIEDLCTGSSNCADEGAGTPRGQRSTSHGDPHATPSSRADGRADRECIVCFDNDDGGSHGALTGWPQCGHPIHEICRHRWERECYNRQDAPRCPVCRRDNVGDIEVIPYNQQGTGQREAGLTAAPETSAHAGERPLRAA